MPHPPREVRPILIWDDLTAAHEDFARLDVAMQILDCVVMVDTTDLRAAVGAARESVHAAIWRFRDAHRREELATGFPPEGS
jgi:hypothetical protein